MIYISPWILTIIKIFFFYTLLIPCQPIHIPSNDSTERTNIFMGKDHLLGNTKKLVSARSNSYSYSGLKGPRFWHLFNSNCAGKNQSPININLSELFLAHYKTLVWSQEYFDLPIRMFVVNDGKGVKLMTYFNESNKTKPYIKHGPLCENYLLEQIHFHWGSKDHTGSEHTVNGKIFSMEMHVVHYRQSAKSFEDALNVPSGVAVIAYFFEISRFDNPSLSIILEKANEIEKTKDVNIQLLNTSPLKNLAQPFYKEYVTYNGSLTTPPCSEVVIWIMSPYTLDISKKQLKRFRAIAEAGGFQNNFRYIQATNNRPVIFVT